MTQGKVSTKLCECGCGEFTALADRTRRGTAKGQPFRFVHGHNGRRPEAERFWARIDKNGPVPSARPDLGPCWTWTGAVAKNGYGSFITKRSNYAHRWSYLHAKGVIPPGFDLDHLCRVRHCANPDHLEVVTRAVNAQRGAMAKFTVDDIAAIRASSLNGVQLAAIYGVHSSTIYDIISGKSWGNVG